MRSISHSLNLLNSFWPCRPNKRENFPDFLVGYRVSEGGHPAVETADASVTQGGLPAKFGVVEQELIVVMPGVTRFVMRWRGKHTVFVCNLPVWLTLQFGTVAGGAMVGIKHAPAFGVAIVQLVTRD